MHCVVLVLLFKASDCLTALTVGVCSIYAVNKIDQITIEELNVLDKLPHYCPVCAYHEWNLTGLVEMIFDYLKLIRIYTKPKGAPRTMLQLLVCF